MSENRFQTGRSGARGGFCQATDRVLLQGREVIAFWLRLGLTLGGSWGLGGIVLLVQAVGELHLLANELDECLFVIEGKGGKIEINLILGCDVTLLVGAEQVNGDVQQMGEV